MGERLSGWRRGLVRVALAVVSAGLGVWVILAPRSDAALLRELEAWRASGDPVHTSEHAGAPGADGPSFEAWQDQVRDLLDDCDRRLVLFATGERRSFSDLTDGETAAAGRLLATVPTAVEQVGVRSGELRRRELEPLATELLATLRSGEPPVAGSPADDFLTVASAVTRPLADLQLARRRGAAPDNREVAVAWAEDGVRSRPTVVDGSVIVPQATALRDRVAVAVRAGDADPALLADAALEAVDCWESTHGAWANVAVGDFGWAVDQAVLTLALAAPHLDAEGLETVRARLEAMDLEAELEQVFLRSRSLDHQRWLRAQRTGRAPAPLEGSGGFRASLRQGWVKRATKAVRDVLDPPLSPREHARTLTAAAAAIASARAEGLDLHRPGTVEDVLVRANTGRFADRVIGEWVAAYEALVADETRRRMALCGLAWEAGGVGGLEGALERYPDPFTGRPFLPAIVDSARVELVLPPAPSRRAPDPTIAWPLVGFDPQALEPRPSHSPHAPAAGGR